MLQIIQAKNAKIPALSQGNVSKYKFLTGKYVLPEKSLLEKDSKVGRLEESKDYSSLPTLIKSKN